MFFLMEVNLFSRLINLVFIFFIINTFIEDLVANCYNSGPASTSSSYDYILPMKKVVSCPTFASFKFSCQTNHIISIEELYFSPVSIGPNGECTSDRVTECHDETLAFDYARKECSGNQSCSFISYQLRSKTTCSHHHVISIFYKCIPTWEITEVPIKCDICKNVTINIYNDMFGFIHSAWYPKLYPRLACHSVIKNRPDHFILIYSVMGSLGLDRIIFETVSGMSPYGTALLVKEILTGNLTTQLILASENDVKINLLAEDAYFFDQRKFLLYFYLVPKCYVIMCANTTTSRNESGPVTVSDGFMPLLSSSSSSSIEHHSVFSSLSSSASYQSSSTSGNYNPYVSDGGYLSSSSSSGYYSSSSSNNYYPTTAYPTYPTTSTTTTTHAVYPTHDSHGRDQNKKPGVLSDAWLAAILALIYALLMIIAVLIAFYCRRRRRRLVQRTSNSKVIINSSTISRSTHIMDRTSQINMIETTTANYNINDFLDAQHRHHLRTSASANQLGCLYSHVLNAGGSGYCSDALREGYIEQQHQTPQHHALLPASLPPSLSNTRASMQNYNSQEQQELSQSVNFHHHRRHHHRHQSDELEDYSQLGGENISADTYTNQNANVYNGDGTYGETATVMIGGAMQARLISEVSSASKSPQLERVRISSQMHEDHLDMVSYGAGGHSNEHQGDFVTFDSRTRTASNSNLHTQGFLEMVNAYGQEEEAAHESGFGNRVQVRAAEDEEQEMSMFVDNSNTGPAENMYSRIIDNISNENNNNDQTVIKHSNNTIVINKN